MWKYHWWCYYVIRCWLLFWYSFLFYGQNGNAAEIQDETSLQLVDQIFTLPTHKEGLIMLDKPLHFELELISEWLWDQTEVPQTYASNRTGSETLASWITLWGIFSPMPLRRLLLSTGTLYRCRRDQEKDLGHYGVCCDEALRNFHCTATSKLGSSIIGVPTIIQGTTKSSAREKNHMGDREAGQQVRATS